MSAHNLCFEQKYEKYHSFLSESLKFLEEKFSIYLNRLVFIMSSSLSSITLYCVFNFNCTIH